MQGTLRGEFEKKQRLGWLWMAAVPAAAVALWMFVSSVGTPTLASAIRSMDAERIVPAARGRALDELSIEWHWADQSRLPEMLRILLVKREAAEQWLRAAGGRPFLFNKWGFAAIIAGSGPLVSFAVNDDVVALAKDQRSSERLDIKPYKLTPRVVMIPLDVIAPFIVADQSARGEQWVTYLSDRPGNPIDSPNKRMLPDFRIAAAVTRAGS